jgi:rRNA-processing protein FCF1
MSVDLLRFLSQYLGRGLLFDANILLVLTIGLYDPLLIARHKRTREKYSPEDFGLILELIEFFQAIPPFTTPQVMTEVSNLLAQSRDEQARLLFSRLSDVIAVQQERYIPSERIASHEQFVAFGLTDIAIFEVASQNSVLVITDDARFADYLGRKEIDVVKFQDLRMLDEV